MIKLLTSPRINYDTLKYTTSLKNDEDKTSFNTAGVSFGGIFMPNAARDITRTLGYKMGQNNGVKWYFRQAATSQAVFDAMFALGINCGLRPAAIMAQSTPETFKKNKNASAHSITSGIVGYGIALVLTDPIARALKKISKNPNTYAKKAMDFLSFNGAKKLSASSRFQAFTMLCSYVPPMLVASLRSYITIALIPVVSKFILDPILKSKQPSDGIIEEKNVIENKYEFMTFKQDKSKNVFQSFMGVLK